MSTGGASDACKNRFHDPRMRHGEPKASALLQAAEEGDAAAVRRALLSGGVDINDGDGSATALIRAAMGGHTDAVRVLLDEEWSPAADCTLADEDGDTALLVAADQGHGDVVCAILGALSTGTALDTKNKAGWNPLLRAVHEGHTVRAY